MDEPQPAQEPPSEWAGIKAILDEYGLQAIDFVADFKAALAQPAREPVAKYSDIFSDGGLDPRNQFDVPKRKWVGLTDEDRKAALLTAYKEWECEEFLLCAREDYLLIEQALKEKNT